VSRFAMSALAISMAGPSVGFECEGGGGLGTDGADGDAAFSQRNDYGVEAGGDVGVGLDDGFEQILAGVFGADVAELGAGGAALAADGVAFHAGHDRLVVEDLGAVLGVAAAQGEAEGRERIGVFGEEFVALGEGGLHGGSRAGGGGFDDFELHAGVDLAGGEAVELGDHEGIGFGVLENGEGFESGALLGDVAVDDEIFDDGRGEVGREAGDDGEGGAAEFGSLGIAGDFHSFGEARVFEVLEGVECGGAGAGALRGIADDGEEGVHGGCEIEFLGGLNGGCLHALGGVGGEEGFEDGRESFGGDLGVAGRLGEGAVGADKAVARRRGGPEGELGDGLGAEEGGGIGARGVGGERGGVGGCAEAEGGVDGAEHHGLVGHRLLKYGGEGGGDGVDGGVVDGERGFADEVGIGVAEEFGDVGGAEAAKGEEDPKTDSGRFVGDRGSEGGAVLAAEETHDERVAEVGVGVVVGLEGGEEGGVASLRRSLPRDCAAKNFTRGEASVSAATTSG